MSFQTGLHLGFRHRDKQVFTQTQNPTILETVTKTDPVKAEYLVNVRIKLNPESSIHALTPAVVCEQW